MINCILLLYIAMYTVYMYEYVIYLIQCMHIVLTMKMSYAEFVIHFMSLICHSKHFKFMNNIPNIVVLLKRISLKWQRNFCFFYLSFASNEINEIFVAVVEIVSCYCNHISLDWSAILCTQMSRNSFMRN